MARAWRITACLALLVAASLAIPAISGAQSPVVPRQVNLTAALLIGLCYYLSQSAWVAGIGFFTLYRPLVAGTLVGVILGAPLQGAQVGAAINLAYLGFVAAGGSLPSDISLAGYLGTALVIGSGLSTEAALALTIPVGVLGFIIFQLRMTIDVIFVRWAERLAQQGSTRGWLWCNVIVPQAVLLLLSLVPCAAAVYWGPSVLGRNLALIPAWLLSGLNGAGALLPVVGLAYSLALLWHERNGAWFILGFLVAALTGWPLLALVLAAGCIAWLRTPRGAECSPAEDLPPEPAATTLPRLTLVQAWLNWLFFSHASYNYERMQALGFTHSLLPVIKRLYPGRDERSDALTRHLVFFNSEPNLGAFIVGSTIALEEKQAANDRESGQVIHALKLGLMGAVSGIGDTLIQGTWVPLALMLAIGLTNQVGLAGPVIYVLLMAATIWGIGALSFTAGYRGGRSFIRRMIVSGSWKVILTSLELVASAMVGVLLARVVRLELRGSLSLGGSLVPLQQLLDSLLPQVVTLVLALVFVWLFRHKAKPGWVVLGVLIVGTVAGAVGVL